MRTKKAEKVRRAPLWRVVVAVGGLGVSLPSVALGQPASPGRAPPSTTVVSTRDYTEQRLEGNQVVTFPGDELPGEGMSYYGDTVRRPPGVLRAGLVRPRLNFVPELLKTVENL